MTVNRRALAKGVAWMAPAITIAASAPSLAASPTVPPKVTGYADKCPGASDVPGGWPKHGYRVVLTADAETVVPVAVLLGNGKYATILTDATQTAPGRFEFVVDATSSPSTLTVTANVDGYHLTLEIKARPHCSGGAS